MLNTDNEDKIARTNTNTKNHAKHAEEQDIQNELIFFFFFNLLKW